MQVNESVKRSAQGSVQGAVQGAAHGASQTSSPTSLPSLPLWQLLGATARALGEVQSGHSSTQILKGLDARLKPGVQALLFLALRQWGRASVIRGLLVSKKPPIAVDQLLCTALALVCASDASPYEPHTLVNQAVEAAKKQLNTKPQAAFLNAVLRRFLREKDALMKQALDTELGRYNHQAWWVAKLKKQYPQDWQDLLERAQTPPPMMLRVNTRLSTRAAYQATLEAQGLHAHTIAGTDQGLVLTQASRVEALPGFREGFCSVQDGHAQWAAALLLEAVAAQSWSKERSSGDWGAFTVLDACAAPGGKTAHLLERLAAMQDKSQKPGQESNQESSQEPGKEAGHDTGHDTGHARRAVELHALEIDEERAHSIELNLNRLGLWGPGQSQSTKPCPTWVQLWVGDGAESKSWQVLRRQRSEQAVLPQPEAFDAILLDAPCSASGIVRRHPDIRWLRREADIPQLVAQQKRLLNALWARLKPGGILLYCTCSVFHEEGQGQIDSFLQHNSQASLRPSPGHLIARKSQLDPSLLDNRSCDQDGFYYAILQKNAVL